MRGSGTVRQPLGVGIEADVRNLDSLPAREFLETIGQVVGLRHGRAVDQHRNERNVAVERRLDLDAHEIGEVIEAAQVGLAGAGQPIPADDGDERVALSDALGQHIDEIETLGDVVDVD